LKGCGNKTIAKLEVVVIEINPLLNWKVMDVETKPLLNLTRFNKIWNIQWQLCD